MTDPNCVACGLGGHRCLDCERRISHEQALVNDLGLCASCGYGVGPQPPVPPLPEEPEPERIVVSYSELAAARHCKLKHHLAYRRRWVQPETRHLGARGIGTDWHLVLQALYLELQKIQAEIRAGQHPGLTVPRVRSGQQWTYPDGTDIRLHAAIRDLAGPAGPVWVVDVDGEERTGPNVELIEWMLVGYLTRWGLNCNWTILAVEYSPVSWLPTPDGNRSRYDLKARLDLVVLDLWTGHIWLVDHKSGQRRPEQRGMAIDDQFGLYTWLLRKLGRPVFGSILSWSKTTQPAKPDDLTDRFIHYRSDRTEVELDRIALDAYRTCVDVYEPVEPPQVGNIPVYPDPEWCKRRCDYLNAHLVERRGGAPLEAYLQDTGWTQDFTRH